MRRVRLTNGCTFLGFTQFEESVNFDAVITELGGIDAIKADPALLDQATEKLSNIDKLVRMCALSSQTPPPF